MDVDSFVVHVRTQYNYVEIIQDFKKRLGTSSCDVKNCNKKQKSKIKILIDLTTKLGGKITKEFMAQRCILTLVFAKCILSYEVMFMLTRKQRIQTKLQSRKKSNSKITKPIWKLRTYTKCEL